MSDQYRASRGHHPQPLTRRARPEQPGPQKRSDLHELRYQRQVSHDIRHELGTIMLLATVLLGSSDIGTQSRARVAQLLAEMRWLEQLLQIHENDPSGPDPTGPAEVLTRLDLVVTDITRSVRLTTGARIRVDAQEIVVHADPLALWRAIRNVVDNAVAAAGPRGRVNLRVYTRHGQVIVEVDDDGPGFEPVTTDTNSLGLEIVEQLLSANGGRMAISRAPLGGCRVRLVLTQEEGPAAVTAQE
jgi:K+-sensing histidine kinase KdpD